MATRRVSWRFGTRRIGASAREVRALGLSVTYPDRVCDLSIQFSSPVDGKVPEAQIAMDEFRRLRDALDEILGGRADPGAAEK